MMIVSKSVIELSGADGEVIELLGFEDDSIEPSGSFRTEHSDRNNGLASLDGDAENPFLKLPIPGSFEPPDIVVSYSITVAIKPLDRHRG
jgi:hypothetical protein